MFLEICKCFIGTSYTFKISDQMLLFVVRVCPFNAVLSVTCSIMNKEQYLVCLSHKSKMSRY